MNTLVKAKYRRSGAGFTLIELLVVVAIIAVLVGMLMPALGAARELSRQTVCETTLKGIIVAEGIYTMDFGRYPYLRAGFGNDQRPVWGQLMWPYLGQQVAAFACPSNKSVQESWVITNGHLGLSSYGVNMGVIDCLIKDQDLDGSKGGRNPETIARPSEKIVNVEVHHPYNVIGWSDFTGWTYFDEPDNGYKLGQAALYNATTNGEVHNRGNMKGANYNYADGHVRWISMQEMSPWVYDRTVWDSDNNPWIAAR